MTTIADIIKRLEDDLDALQVACSAESDRRQLVMSPGEKAIEAQHQKLLKNAIVSASFQFGVVLHQMGLSR